MTGSPQIALSGHLLDEVTKVWGELEGGNDAQFQISSPLYGGTAQQAAH
jgi:hypothetical protein